MMELTIKEDCLFLIEHKLLLKCKFKQILEMNQTQEVSLFTHLKFKPLNNLVKLLLKNKNKERFLGTTKRGIGPTYAAKSNRVGLRVGTLFKKIFKKKVQNTILLK